MGLILFVVRTKVLSLRSREGTRKRGETGRIAKLPITNYQSLKLLKM
ncbi:MAG: hypothetical protein HC942_01720 [Microcoleus sp. SU_5_6]|nr:hypothetical protein [Microcoleus sp. SU_5_6]NJL68600.1 hypothetical protein [Microcoleus sp. SM1_3_4]